MNEDEKEAIKIYENFLDDISKNGGCIIDIDYQHKEEYQAMWKVFRLIEKQQAEIEKKDKIIDLMALDIYGMQMECNRYFKDTEEVINNFERKIEQ